MKKEEIATCLENLAKTIRKDSVKVDDANIDIDMHLDNIEISGAWVEHIPSGKKSINISIDYYDRECDETAKKINYEEIPRF